MPKTRFDKHSKPPIDKVKAIVLERMRSPSSKWPFGKVVQMMKVMNVPVEDFTSAVRY